jgi:hypothetical protein
VFGDIIKQDITKVAVCGVNNRHPPGLFSSLNGHVGNHGGFAGKPFLPLVQYVASSVFGFDAEYGYRGF